MKNILILALMLCGTVLVEAKDIKRPDSFNFNRGMEACLSYDYETALNYLNKEVKDNPNNGYAYLWIAAAYIIEKEYGLALTAIDKAVKLVPKKDGEFRCRALLTRARIYEKLEQYDLALEDYNQIIKEFPDNADAYEERAQIYYEQEKYNLADKDYGKLVSLDPGSVMGYMGLGRNAKNQGLYDDAIKQFDFVVSMHPDYSSGYSFRAESYFKLGRYDEAIDDMIKALEIDGDDKAFYLMQEVVDSAFMKVVLKLKIQVNKEPHNDYWYYCLGVAHEAHDDYRKAIEDYKQSYAIEPFDGTARRIAMCYEDLGDYDSALRYIDLAIEGDSTDYNYVGLKAGILDNAGRSDEAIAVMDKGIQIAPEYYFAYYRRGWIKDHSGDIEGAIEDYSMSIALRPEYAYNYMNRGVLYRLKGENALAEDDFRKVTELDTIPSDDNTAQYAYFYLGEREKAVAFQDSILAKYGDDKGNNYDAACLYSLMGEKEKSLECLRKSLELGYRNFHHIRRDRDLSNIRDTEEFKALLEEYETKHRESLEEQKAEDTPFEEATAEIPYIKDGGVFSVKCAINDLPLNFIFDTGASDVTMSAVEANFMMKNGYLTPRDIEGKQYYQIANGDISEGTVVNIRDVEFGGLHLFNVKASVVKSQRAPLLLGQSALQKLGKIEIDNDRKVLKITYRKPSTPKE